MHSSLSWFEPGVLVFDTFEITCPNRWTVALACGASRIFDGGSGISSVEHKRVTSLIFVAVGKEDIASHEIVVDCVVVADACPDPSVRACFCCAVLGATIEAFDCESALSSFELEVP